MTAAGGSCPELPLQPWRATLDTLHMYAQIVGKIRLALSPPEPQWAHVALYVTPRGLTTGPMPFDGRSFAIDFDLVEHCVRFSASDGRERSIPLVPRPVAEFYALVLDTLREFNVGAHVWPMPVEVPHPIRFDADREHRSYDAQAVRRFARALMLADAALKEHRAPFRLRHTPVQFFFGTFDLAYARFSGRPATPPSAGVIMRNAMDAEEICAGFWPGDERFPEAAFWSYAFPKPPGAQNLAVRPAAAFWSEPMGEFLLRYEDVRNAASPRAALREFFASTFEGFARLAGWPPG